METFFKDLTHSLRMFRQNPGFTLTAVAALAVGIGANTAIFSVVDAVLLKPLTYPEPDRIVEFMNISPHGSGGGASVPKFAAWRAQTGILQDTAAYDNSGPGLNLTGGAYPEQIKGIHVTVDYFRLFGAHPMPGGRTFTAEEDRPNGGHFVVLSYGFWKRRFGGDPQMVGKSISLGGDPYIVTGIIGPGFRFDPAPDVWIPFQFDLNSDSQANYFSVAGRLKPGVTLEAAKAQMNMAGIQFRRKYPTALGQDQSFGAQKLQDSVVGDVRNSLYVLLAAVGCVLLIACANVANLLLVRATGRKREIAIRAAVGAGRGRIIRQLLTESALLSFGGGMVGLIFGMLGVRVLLSVNPGNLPRIGEDGSGVALDWQVLLFTLFVSILVGVLFGLIPALTASRADLNVTLKESTSRSGSGFRQNKARGMLVVTQVALALILLIGSALLIRTFAAMRAVQPGFESRHVLTMRMSLTGPRFEKTAGVAQLSRDGVTRLESLPGVEAAGSTCCLPLEGGFGLPFNVVGRPITKGPFTGGAGWMNVSARYFDIFKIRIVRGRAFTDHDDGAGARVAIINETMARQYWPKGDPLRDRIVIGPGVGPAFDEPARQIVGITSDVRDRGLTENPQPTMYVPQAQVTDGITALNSTLVPVAWIVRTKGDPLALSNQIQNELRQASGGLPVARVRTMDQIVINSTARADFNMLLLTVFAASALLLASIGIYGLISYSVAQRTQEIGIRMALGAETSNVRNLIVGQGMRLALVGVVLGVGAAFGLTRLIAGFLYGVKAVDPLVFIGVPLLLIAVSLFATWLPARRATRIDPINALRYE